MRVIARWRGLPATILLQEYRSSIKWPNCLTQESGQHKALEAVEGRPATFDLGPHDRPFERVDQRDGKLPWILSGRQFPFLLRFPQACSECRRPIAIDRRKLAPHLLARRRDLQGHVPDQAADRVTAALVKLGKPGEIPRDARQGRRPALIQNGPILGDNRLPIFRQYGDGEGFLAVEVIVERTLGDAGCRGNLLHARGVEAAGAHKLSPFFQEARSRFGIGLSRHGLIYDRSSYYRQVFFSPVHPV